MGNEGIGLLQENLSKAQNLIQEYESFKKKMDRHELPFLNYFNQKLYIKHHIKMETLLDHFEAHLRELHYNLEAYKHGLDQSQKDFMQSFLEYFGLIKNVVELQTKIQSDLVINNHKKLNFSKPNNIKNSYEKLNSKLKDCYQIASKFRQNNNKN